ncbi:hypothetical protein C1631_007150 [Chryseobacterium phosphatilyticum]|uniref:Uncharacterized protein n=1 Tax=Chryseobacterium phosphatilyticum TaxID=475075 RepID=A0A316XHV1_9FLAO|nr:hypothetical protein [Chryseobacterium phosphatilyticum]PWN72366.1 hypothetical protein C1631_007150 [Chryseobacterium phosphatilyticum]
MNNNLYWVVYKNIEKEIIELSNLIHFDDTQLTIYSVRIAELLIRTVVEIESISKELYFLNGGEKPNDNELYFDTDCLEFLETKWLLSKKVVFVSAANFYFQQNENKILVPLKKANKRGSSSSDWQKAYQAVKHNRAKNLTKGNLKYLIRASSALYILNIYYKDTKYNLGHISTTSFDNSQGSQIFSIKIHTNNTINIEGTQNKEDDYDECIYLIHSTVESSEELISLLKTVNEEVNAKVSPIIQAMYPELNITNLDDINDEVTPGLSTIIEQHKIGILSSKAKMLEEAYSKLQNEAVPNKNQY